MDIEELRDMVSKKEPLFSSMIYALKPVEGEEYPTLGTDGEFLFYNQKFVDSLTPEEGAAAVLHEVFHCAHRHVWRRGKRDAYKWNIATDYSINIMVNESFKLPKGALLDMKYFGMSAEEIYDTLPKMKQKQQEWCEKNGWSDQKNGKGSGKNKENKSKNGKGGLLDKISRALQGKKPLPKSQMTEEEKDAKWKKLYEKTFIKNFGSMPDSIKRVIEKTHYVPVLDWASIVSSLLSEDTNDYTFSQPDRRFLDGDFILPDLYSYDRLKDVVFAYDTSGSITEDDLKAFYMETLNLFSNFSSIQGWIAVCDAYLHSFEEVSPQQSFEDFHFYGGGGTDFRPVFDKIKERGMKPKALFYFTDTEGSFPSEEPPYPVFWLVKTEIGQFSEVYVPWGTVIRFLTKS